MLSETITGDGHPSLGEFVDGLQASGRYTFTRDNALAAIGGSEPALKQAVSRLARKQRLVAPRRGFFVVVPLEYRSAGAPPPSWFIDDLMRYQGRPYYVALLSAAALHGAAHQQPQEFQVVTDRLFRAARAGRARLRFFLKRHFAATPSVDVKTETGTMRVSSPEATVFDLVRYVDGAGGLGNVATVLSELGTKLDPERLVEAAQADVELSVVQRAGHVLEAVGVEPCVTDRLAAWLADQRPRVASLRPERAPRDGTDGSKPAIDERWHLLVNEVVEVDA